VRCNGSAPRRVSVQHPSPVAAPACTAARAYSSGAQPCMVVPKQDLCSGSAVRIGGSGFCVSGLLSHGSFGAVWVASRRFSKDNADANVVIKEILCRSRSSLHAAEFEGQILRQCAAWVHAGALEQVPALLSMEKESIGPECWRVRLAMTRLPGEPLDDFLEKQEAAGAPPREFGVRFARALAVARELLLQLGAAMDQISTKVYHRDVHPRNMLLEERGDGRPPLFGLVDFGLAVGAESWRAGGWSSRGAGGDCRYWPTSAWVMFGQGSGALEEQPGLRREYETRLDLHALGLSALEVLVRLMPSSPSDEASEQEPPATALAGLQGLRAAWAKYWQDVSRFWEVVYGAYAGGKDIRELKAACTEVGVHAIVATGLRQLRAALRELRCAGGGPVQAAADDEAEDEATEGGSVVGTAADEGLFALVDALLQLVSDGDEPEETPTWGGICELLARPSRSSSAAATPPPPAEAQNVPPPAAQERALSAAASERRAAREAEEQEPSPTARPPPQSPMSSHRVSEDSDGQMPPWRPVRVQPAEETLDAEAGQRHTDSRKSVKLSDEVIVAHITTPSTPRDNLDMVEYVDDDGDLICFQLEAGQLVTYCNGKRGVGVGVSQDSTGIVTELKWFSTDGEGWGGSIADQFNCGGMIPQGKLKLLRDLAERAGVPTNIPCQFDASEVAQDPPKVKEAQDVLPARPHTPPPSLEPEPEATPTHNLPVTPRSPQCFAGVPSQHQQSCPKTAVPPPPTGARTPPSSQVRFPSTARVTPRAYSPPARSVTPLMPGGTALPVVPNLPSRGSSCHVPVGSPLPGSRQLPAFATRSSTPSRPTCSMPAVQQAGPGLPMTLPVWRPSSPFTAAVPTATLVAAAGLMRAPYGSLRSPPPSRQMGPPPQLQPQVLHHAGSHLHHE